MQSSDDYEDDPVTGDDCETTEEEEDSSSVCEKWQSRKEKEEDSSCDFSYRCSWCFSGIKNGEEVYRLCNCKSIKVHLECVQRSGRSGLTSCAICGVKYRVYWKKDSCVICGLHVDEERADAERKKGEVEKADTKKEADEKAEKAEKAVTRPCRCVYGALHRGCFEKAAEQKECEYCKTEFRLERRQKWKINWSAVLYILAVLAGIFVWFFFVGGMSFVNWLQGKEFMGIIGDTTTTTTAAAKKGTSFLLFPGLANLVIVDLLYLVGYACTVILGIFFWVIRRLQQEENEKQRLQKVEDGQGQSQRQETQRRKQKERADWACWGYLVSSFCILMLHGFGNAHYALWCSVDVLLVETCDALPRFDIFTFGAGMFPVFFLALLFCVLAGLFSVICRRREEILVLGAA